MEYEELGGIREREVFEAVGSGKVIESYPEDEPYPSCLIYGKTSEGRNFIFSVPIQKKRKRLQL